MRWEHCEEGILPQGAIVGTVTPNVCGGEMCTVFDFDVSLASSRVSG